MPENYRFKSEMTHDLPTILEFDRYTLGAYPKTIIQQSALILILFAILFMSGIASCALICIITIAAMFLVWLISFLKNRYGNISYKRTLAAHQGTPPHFTLYFCEDGIYDVRDDGVIDRIYHYDQICKVIETPNLLVLMMPYRVGIILQKDTLAGGTQEELITFLGWHCPNWKDRKILRGTAYKVLNWIMLAIMVLTLISGICNLAGVRPSGKEKATLTNDMTYQQMAQELSTLGITISDRAIQELEAMDEEHAAAYGEDYYTYYSSASKIYDLLYWESAGFYDEETWKWTPSQSGVYYCEIEVWNEGAMYSDFFTGLTSMNSELDFSEVTEDYSAADLEKGTGKVTVSFNYGSTTYVLDADYDYDWFDTDILDEVGAVLATDENQKDLYVYYDGEGCMLYYGTAEQAASLSTMSGLDFELANSN